jgi:hypothetical protein
MMRSDQKYFEYEVVHLDNDVTQLTTISSY